MIFQIEERQTGPATPRLTSANARALVAYFHEAEARHAPAVSAEGKQAICEALAWLKARGFGSTPSSSGPWMQTREAGGLPLCHGHGLRGCLVCER